MSPLTDRALYYAQASASYLASHLTVLAGKIAVLRADHHAFAHALASLIAGNTTPCNLEIGDCTLYDPEIDLDMPDQTNLSGDLELPHWSDSSLEEF